MNTRILIIIFVALALLSGGLFLFNRFKPEPLSAIQLEKQSTHIYVTVTGEVRADHTVAVSPSQPAILDNIYVEEGQWVRKGMPLARLRQNNAAAQVASAQAAIAAAQANLATLQEGTRPEELRLRQQQVQEARQSITRLKQLAAAHNTQYNNAAKIAQRYQQLYQEEVLSAQEHDTAQNQKTQAYQQWQSTLADVSAAEARLKQNQAALQQAQNGPRQTDIAAAKAQVAQAQAEKAALVANQGELQLFSPVNGIVTKQFQQEGDLAQPGKTAFELIDPQTLEIIAFVEEPDINQLQLGGTAEVLLDALPDKILPATIAEIGKRVNPENGTIEVILALTPKAQAIIEAAASQNTMPLRPGMTADINVLLQQVQNGILIPASAARRTPQGWQVYVIEGNRLVEKPVKLKRLASERLQILSGVTPGDWVAEIAPENWKDYDYIQPKPASTE